MCVKRIWRRLLVLTGTAALAVLLSGCLATSTVEELFTLPQPPIEYTELTDTITALLAGGYEYASPTAGQNIQPVQMVDLDWDGHSEALAFFRRPTDEKPLKIMIFSARDEGYVQRALIESSGTAIERVEYEDMNGDGVRELVVGWRISSDVQTVAVYDVDAQTPMLMQSNYTRYTVQELDGDGLPSLLVFRSNELGESVAEVYSWRGDGIDRVHQRPLSSTMAALSAGSVVSGMLDKDTPAVFVTGINEEGMAVTDILACRENGTMTNAALNSATGLSGLIYPYRHLQPQDINADGIVEVPAPAALAELGKPNDGLVDWMQCSIDGQIRRVATTYHCQSVGWYLAVPEAWVGRLTTAAWESVQNENQVLLRLDGEPVASVYAITGENRESRAMRGSRQVLRRQTDIIYAGEVLSEKVDFTIEDLRSSFKLIVSSWNS